MNTPLLDLDFLKQLDLENLKEVYAEILALNLQGEIIESIEGYVTQGSINIDGTSSVRRTCSLTLVTDRINLHEYYWGLHTKFKLNLGVKNNINKKYPDIIWFKQGEFVITNFTTSQSTSNYTISISGKDKMTLLNGELGGTIPSLTWDFGMVENEDAIGVVTKEKVLIKDIIIGAVHQFAKEPFYKIIVNDLDDKGLELMEYRGDTPLYVIMNEDTKEYYNMTLDSTVSFKKKGTNEEVKIEDLSEEEFNPLFELDNINRNYLKLLTDNGDTVSVAKITYGMTAGYRDTDLVYAGELILNIGDPVTKMLDSLVTMLGDFEYFYDVDGNFIFQRKAIYETQSWNTIKDNKEEIYVENSTYTSAFTYSLEDGLQVISYSNNPNFSNLRNDFSVWGERKGAEGASIPIHARFAIDKKPILFVNKEGNIYTSLNKDEIEIYIQNFKEDFILENYNDEKIKLNLDWREIIYQMALDYNKHHLEDDYYINLMKNNFGIYTHGKTGYEQYYVDLEGFWRMLYCPKEEISTDYEAVFPFREEYEKNCEDYYYDVPNFYSDMKEPFQLGREYYTYIGKNSELLEKVENLTADEYTSGEKVYYWIHPYKPTIKASCQIIEPYRGEDYEYIDKNGKIIKLEKNEYKNHEGEYYYLKAVKYKPTSSILAYRLNDTYYSNGEKVEYLDKDKYYAEPYLYQLKEYVYNRCSENEIFDSNKNYYKEVYNRSSNKFTYSVVRNLSENTFKQDRTSYFTRSDKSKYIDCVELYKTEYNEKYSYFIRTLQDKTYVYLPKEINQTNYLEEAKKGELYYLEEISECCIHPADFDTTPIFYKGKQKEYNEDGWAKEVITSPEKLNFWFDFIDENSEMVKYGSNIIGNRPKGVNDSQIKSIYFRETPTIIFANEEIYNKVKGSKLGYTYLQITKERENLFSISSQGKSAKAVIDQMVYQMAQNSENITITTLPIYSLIPNSRIFVRNDESNINGEYIVSRYSITLGNSGNMTINAYKALDKLY